MWAPQRDVAQETFFALVALQHRGQESAGIAAAAEDGLHLYRATGLVGDVFTPEIIEHLYGHAAIGHVRYSTTEDRAGDALNAQPLMIRYQHGELALSFNGSIVNAAALRRHLESLGSIFQSSLDCEVFAHLIARSSATILEDALQEAVAQVQGGYAIIFLTADRLIALRDPHGIRPLTLGMLGGHYLVSSESCAFDTLGGSYLREVAPGEMVTISAQGLQSRQGLTPAVPPSLCAFEHIYFARPDSDIEGVNTHFMRKRLGAALVQEAHLEVDVISGVPDSSISAAIGYAEASGVPFEMALIKNRYLGRTFIKPTQEQRELAVKLKLNPVRKLVEGKRVLLVDDSIVRGTTMRYIIHLLREVGATEVHVRITSPPYRYPCYFGIDTSARGDLIASNRSVEEIREAIEADSLYYLDIETITRLMGNEGLSLCLACFNGNYPVSVPGSH